MAYLRDVQILADTANQFIAEQPPYGFSFLMAVIILVLAGAAIYAFRQGAWKTSVIMIFVTTFLAWITWPRYIAYRMELKNQQQILEIQTIQKGKVIESQTIKFSDIARVDMQFNRGSKRIAVISKDGKEVFPLGDEYIQDETNQYKPLVAIQKAVGQTPSSQ